MKFPCHIIVLSLLAAPGWSFTPQRLVAHTSLEDGRVVRRRWDLSVVDRSDNSAADTAMNDFFLANHDWHPVFRSLAVDDTVPAMNVLSDNSPDSTLLLQQLPLDTVSKDASSLPKDGISTPWRQLQAIPSDEQERQVVAAFLDSMQKTLLDIPCEAEEDDEFDVQFIEEGRRMLAVSRFQVLSQESELFSTCWNELYELNRLDEANTGSLIVLPEGYDIEQLNIFADANLMRPLEWLGLHMSFEISSITRGNLALRMLHKLTRNEV